MAAFNKPTNNNNVVAPGFDALDLRHKIIIYLFEYKWQIISEQH